MKITRLLRLINSYEWSHFERFVASPYFNKGRNYIPLLRILKKFHPEFDNEKVTKEFLHSKLYPGKKFNEDVMNTVLSGLSSLCEDFFLQLNFNRNPQKEIRLLKEYSKRGYDSGASRLCMKISGESKGKPIGSMMFFENLDKVDAVQAFYAMNYDKTKRSKALHDGLQNLICFTMIQSSIFKKELLLYGKRYSVGGSDATLSEELLSAIDTEKIIRTMESSGSESYLILKLYNLLVEQLNDIENDKPFFELKQILNSNRGKLDEDTVKKIMLNLVSVCNMKHNHGKKEFMKESYSLMKHLAECRFYDNIEDSPHFPPSHFRNIVKAGIALNDIEWVREFVNDNAGKLERSISSSIKNYSLAKIDFAEGNYDSVIVNLSKVETDNLVFRLDVRKLSAMTYFETRSYENLRSLLNAYLRMASKSAPKSEDILTRHRNFIRHMQHLVNFIESSKPDKTELLASYEVLKRENTSEKSWLIEKYSSLISVVPR